MGRWQALIDDVADLEAETPGEGLRTSIDHKIWKAETRASNLAAPATRAEKSTTHRKREFQAALRLTLGALRVRDPSNEIWAEALHLLEDPRLRTSDGSH
jgi:hypothetical protein